MQLDPNRDFNPYSPPAAPTDAYRYAPTDDVQILADPGTRLVAQMINTVLGVTPLCIMVLGISAKGTVMVGLGLLLSVGLLAYQSYLVATTGQSLAKRWLGIKIVRTDGSPVNFVTGVLVRSWLLYFLSLIPVFGGLFGLADALFIFGEARECLHDKIADTKVILATPPVRT